MHVVTPPPDEPVRAQLVQVILRSGRDQDAPSFMRLTPTEPSFITVANAISMLFGWWVIPFIIGWVLGRIW